MPLPSADIREGTVRGAIETQKNTGAGAPSSDVQTLADKIAGMTPRKALEGVAVPPSANKDKAEKAMGERIGWRKDAATGAVTRDTGENTRLTTAKGADNLARLLLVDNGSYDRLTPSERKLVRDEIERAVRELLPDQADALLGPKGGTASGNKDQTLEGLINDPQFMDKLRLKRNEILERQMTTNDASIEEKQRTLEQKRASDEKVGKEIKQLKKDLSAQNKILEGFADKNKTVVGTDAYRLQELRVKTPIIERDIAQSEHDVASFSDLVDKLRFTASDVAVKTGTVPTSLADELKSTESKLKKAIDNLHKNKALVSERDELVAKQSKAEETKTRLEEKIEEAQFRKETTAREGSIAQADFDHAKLSRSREEEQYAQDLEDVIKNTAEEIINDRINAAQSAQSELLQKEAQELADRDVKKVVDALAVDGLEWDKKKKESVLNKKKALEVGARIKSPSEGLDKVIEGYLLSGVTSPSAEYDRLTAKLKDKKFLDEMRAKAGPVLVGRFLQAGGKFSEGDVMYLQSTEWGQNLIENGVKNNEALSKQFEAAGIKPDKSFFDRLKSVDKKTWLTILALILGGAVAAVGIVPTATAVAGAAKGAIAGTLV